jgi:ribosomal-protein-alanine N-acetyltransferase
MMTKPREAFPALSSRRLRLRRVERSDASGLHACSGDPDAMRYWDFQVLETIAEKPPTLRRLATRRKLAARTAGGA